MKGLQNIPSISEFQKAYEKLQFKEKSVDEKEVSLWSQWARLDPRLAELLTAHLIRRWKNLSPMAINFELKKQPWPSALGVLLETIGSSRVVQEGGLFDNWMALVMTDIEKGPFSQFFFGQRAIGGKEMQKDVQLATAPFLKWGYFAREKLISKTFALPQQTSIPEANRRVALQEFLKTNKRITVSDYIRYLGGNISRRQAQLDLKKFGRLRVVGNTRGRIYFSK